MERVDLELSDFTRRAGSVLLAHSDTGLGRGLEPEERVLVRDGVGGHRLATVRDVSFDLTDTHYRLELGAEVSPAEAQLLLSENPRDERAAVALSDVLDLLREARRLSAEGTRLPGALLR